MIFIIGHFLDSGILCKKQRPCISQACETIFGDVEKWKKAWVTIQTDACNALTENPIIVRERIGLMKQILLLGTAEILGKELFIKMI